MEAVPHTIQLYRGTTAKRRYPSSSHSTPPRPTTKRSSPSSVVLAMGALPSHSPSSRSSPQKRTGSASKVRRSIVVMDDNGAELVAEFDSLSVSNKQQQRPQQQQQRTPRKPARSLLDDESTCYTPTPPPSSKMRSNRTPPTSSTASTSTEVALCCPSLYSLDNCLNKYDHGVLELINVQRKIHALLGDPKQIEALFRDWQVWSYFGGGMTAIPGQQLQVKEEDVKRALRNSISMGLQRRHRMESVRKDLNPFSLTPNRQQTRSPAKFGTVKSFDITGRSPRRPRHPDPSSNSRSKPQDNSNTSNDTASNNLTGSLVQMLERGCMCTTNQSKVVDSPALIRSGMLNAVHEETCYDSDPEDFTRRRPRKLQSPTKTTAHSPRSSRSNFNEGSPSSSPSNKENRNNLQFHKPHPSMGDDYVIAQMVQEFMNERFTFILHTKDQTSKSSSAPHATTAWFERGQHLGSGSVIQPRFMWHLVERNSTKKFKRKIALPTTGAVSFDLVDVSRVLSVGTIERKYYPFAKPSSCFLIKTLDKSFLFEAKSADERERVVRLLKLVVARLGSKLIVGDQSFFEEFFVTMPDGPGEAPDFVV